MADAAVSDSFELQCRLFGSIEDFLRADTLATLNELVDETIGRLPRASIDTMLKKSSIHAIEGYSSEHVAQLYSPQGRIELTDLAPPLAGLLDASIQEQWEKIRRLFPSARHTSDWTIVEYTEGQYVSDHIDLPFAEDGVTPPKLGAISIQLRAAERGGEFYLQTCDLDLLWGSGRDQETNHTSEWFRRLRKSPWVNTAQVGTLLAWGSRLIHGTRAVTAGRARKALTFIHS